jgi:hypothetical protein
VSLSTSWIRTGLLSAVLAARLAIDAGPRLARMLMRVAPSTQHCKHIRRRAESQIRAYRCASRESRKLLGIESADFCRRNASASRQRADSPLVLGNLVRIGKIEVHRVLLCN